MYKVQYLKIATTDMSEIVSYISKELSNPLTAEKMATHQ